MKAKARLVALFSRSGISRGQSSLAIAICALLAMGLVATPAGAATATVFEDSFGSPGGGAGQFGSASEEVNGPAGLTTSTGGKGGASKGDLYVTDTVNNRIQHFDKDGNFIRAFGYDVVSSGQDNSGANEQQTVTVPATVTAGTFTLTVTSATGLGTRTGGSDLIKGVGATSGAFQVGDTIGGAGIPAGTTILEVKATELKLSANATGAGSFVTALTATETTTAIPYNAEAASGAENVKEKLEALPVIGAGNVTVSGGPGAVNPFTITFSGGLLSHNDVAQMSATSTLTGGSATVATAITGGGYEVCKAESTPIDVCKAGSASASAGAMSEPQGIAIDQSNGNLYVTDQGNRRVDVFSATGAFQGAFGWGVDTGAGALEFCTTASTCQVGLAGAGAGQFGTALGNPAVDPTSSPAHVYVASKSNRRVDEFAPVLSGSTVTGVSFVRGLGRGVATGAAAIQECAASCLMGSEGTELGAFGNTDANPISIAVDAAGTLYAVNRRPLPGVGCGEADQTRMCRVVKFNSPVGVGPGKGPIAEFAKAELTRTSGNPFAVGVQTVAIDPATQNLLAAQGNGAITKYVVKELDSAGNLLGVAPPVTGPEQGITTLGGFGNGVKGLAIGTAGRMYVANSNFKVEIFGPPPPPEVTTPSVSALGATSATFSGTVTPPPPALNPSTGNLDKYSTTYRFEYSLDGLNWTRFPVEDIAIGDGSGAGSPNNCPVGNPSSCNVSRTAKDLLPNRTYQVRIVASTGSQVTSAATPFTTKVAPPTVSGMSAEAVTQAAAKFVGFVNPNGEATTYRFEWGTDASYGKQIPAETEAFAGSGSKAVKVSANVSGLSPETAYHFRIVATNPAGETKGDDQEVLTLNEANLPSDRGYELVSPPDKRPQGAVESLANQVTAFQAADDGDALVYPVIGGLADSTAGGHVIHLAERGASAWDSAQISAPSLVPNPGNEIRTWPSTQKYLSDDLSCVVLETGSPLTADTPPADVELGVTNLYRRNPDGSHTLLSNTVPTNLQQDSVLVNGMSNGTYYTVAGASADCKRIFFKTWYKLLPGTPSGLYEWEDTGAGGVLRDAGLRPDGSVPPSPFSAGLVNSMGFGALVGGIGLLTRSGLSQFNAVSPSGSVFFSAISNAGKDSGQLAVFMRKTDGTVVDVSQSQTVTTALGARYETASPDGSHVFFAGSYGRAAVPGNATIADCSGNEVGSGPACSLYDYDVDAGTLEDLTATTDPGNPKGAAVEGVVAVDDDGSHVYFAAWGQLVPDQGSTYAQNSVSQTVNVYLAANGSLSYVATIPKQDLERSDATAGSEAPGGGGNLMRASATWTAQSTPDGDRLLFTSTGNVTGYESGGVAEAYLYDAASGATVCVSCRTDGKPSVGDPPSAAGGTEPIRSALSVPQADFTVPRSLSDDGGRVFFTMPDALTPGATEGARNLYEWRKGVVHWLATFNGNKSLFVGASDDGRDVFIATQEQLSPHDFDFDRDVYDIRAGGGFAPPESDPVPCDPAADQCQGPVIPAPATSTPASESVTGPGNPAAKKQQQKKKKKKNQGRKRKKAQKKRAQQRRVANDNRGGAK